MFDILSSGFVLATFLGSVAFITWMVMGLAQAIFGKQPMARRRRRPL